VAQEDLGLLEINIGYLIQMTKGHALAGAYSAQSNRYTRMNVRYLYVTGRYYGSTITIRQRELTARTTVPQSELNAFAGQIQSRLGAPTPGAVTLSYYFHSK
jgi:hypothetical protein